MYKFLFDIVEENGSCVYNNDNITTNPKEVIVTGYPVKLTNIKLFNKYLTNEQAIKESLKYTTTCESCVLNDLARPLDYGNGYSVK